MAPEGKKLILASSLFLFSDTHSPARMRNGSPSSRNMSFATSKVCGSPPRAASCGLEERPSSSPSSALLFLPSAPFPATLFLASEQDRRDAVTSANSARAVLRRIAGLCRDDRGGAELCWVRGERACARLRKRLEGKKLVTESVEKDSKESDLWLLLHRQASRPPSIFSRSLALPNSHFRNLGLLPSVPPRLGYRSTPAAISSSTLS